jgi:hypothetical protein
MTFSQHQKSNAASWKRTTPTLPDEARGTATYVDKDGGASGPARDFCLPPAFAAQSLLPEVREPALALFAELGIPWHAGVDGGPSNHLLSSQVQCVNALGQMVHDPARIKRAFGDELHIDEVLEVEPGRFLTFEYIGPQDWFGESPGVERTRGAHCTSVDAAFLHRALDGEVELVLIEWKYTESYRVRRPDPAKDAVRRHRYADAVADPRGPIRSDVLPFDLLLDEPFYQLVRQQLLAHALEQHRVLGASRVRIVHVSPRGNEAYQQSLPRPEHRALESTVSQVWQQFLRTPDRFLSVDSGLFLDVDLTSRDYVLRYSDDVVFDLAGLLAAYDVEDAVDVENALHCQHDFDGDLLVREEGIELYMGSYGYPLDYPFAVSELRERAETVWREENGMESDED